MGVAKDGSKKDNFQLGVELRGYISLFDFSVLMLILNQCVMSFILYIGRITLLAEGCRGSLAEVL